MPRRQVKLSDDAIETLRDLIDPPEQPPETGRTPDSNEPWSPSLGPTQQRIFDSPCRQILAYGEKGSGKSIGCIHKVVRHCYENDNALVVILVHVRSMATKGGAWDKLVNMVIPEWTKGLGIQASDPKQDSQKNEYIWIENQFGRWSQVLLISAPHPSQLRVRIRGYEPSMVFVDELTSCEDETYLQAVSAQVGRRPGIQGPQQYIAACNPEGPSHWVYKVWWEDAFDETTGLWDPDYEKYHVPISENEKNLPPGYLKNLIKLYRKDPVEAARMLHGEWIDRPSGTAIFRENWNPNVHVFPDPKDVHAGRIMPHPDYPIIIGADPGATHNAFIFLQRLPLKNRMQWVVFDEMVYVKRRILYSVLMPAIVRRWSKWNEAVFGKDRPADKFLRAVWISDNSAFNQFRAAGGSFDVLELEKAARPECARLGLPPVRFRQAPKFKGSVAARVGMTMDAMSGEEPCLIVSSACKKMRRSFELLESVAQKTGEPYDPSLGMQPARSEHLHPFDAFSYPLLCSSTAPGLLVPAAAPDATKSSMFAIGD